MNFALPSCSTATMSGSILRASTGEDTAKAAQAHTAIVPARTERAGRTGSGLHIPVELGRGQRALEVAEAALSLHLPRGVHEPAHRGAIKGRGEAHAPHARGLELGYRERLALDASHEVHRFLQRSADCAHRGEIGKTRGHQDVRTRF